MRVREHIMNSIFSNDEMTILNNKYQQLLSMFNKPKKTDLLWFASVSEDY